MAAVDPAPAPRHNDPHLTWLAPDAADGMSSVPSRCHICTPGCPEKIPDLKPGRSGQMSSPEVHDGAQVSGDHATGVETTHWPGRSGFLRIMCGIDQQEAGGSCVSKGRVDRTRCKPSSGEAPGAGAVRRNGAWGQRLSSRPELAKAPRRRFLPTRLSCCGVAPSRRVAALLLTWAWASCRRYRPAPAADVVEQGPAQGAR